MVCDCLLLRNCLYGRGIGAQMEFSSVFCRAWLGSVEGYNGLVVGMSDAEENND